MKPTLFKLSGPAIAAVVFGSVIIASIHAQQAQPIVPPATTRWMGFLVVGQNDTFDRMTPGPSPTTLRKVEIGLRSDGVVMWRDTTARKATTQPGHESDR